MEGWINGGGREDVRVSLTLRGREREALGGRNGAMERKKMRTLVSLSLSLSQHQLWAPLTNSG